MKQINCHCKAESWSDKLGYCTEISSAPNLQIGPRLKKGRVSDSLEECLLSLNLIFDSAVARTLSQNIYIKCGVSLILELWPWFVKYLVVHIEPSKVRAVTLQGTEAFRSFLSQVGK